MPRSKMTETQEVRRRLMHNIGLIQGRQSCETMGKAIGVSAATFSRKRKDPETFTLSEIRLLCKTAGVPVELFLTQELRVSV